MLVNVQARRSAQVTHMHPVGIDGAAVQAAAVAAALDDGDPLAAACRTADVRRALDDVRRRTRRRLDPAELRSTASGVSSRADDSVAAAVVAGSLATDFEQAVTAAIRAGGDTDTVGAMAGAIAGARFGASSVPQRWLDALEDGERGRSHVERLAAQLAKRAQAPYSGAAALGSR